MSSVAFGNDMVKLVALLELWLALLLIALCCTVSRSGGVVYGEVVAVRSEIRQGEVVTVITYGIWDGDHYSQVTAEFPFGSREAVLFGASGRCIGVQPDGRLIACE